MMSKLDRLRGELAALDRKLLEIAAERSRLAGKIGRVKRERGLPVRDFAQEREVVERARRIAEELSLSPRLAEELILASIRAALAVQEREGITTSAGGTGKRALVIGGAGKMGRWFVNFLGSQDYEVEIADPEPAAPEGLVCYRDWRECDLGHEVIVAAAPLVATNQVLLEMADNPPRGLVFDIGSLKSPLREGLFAMAEAGAKVTSIHPMFGPDTELLSGRHVVFVDVGAARATAEARDLFRSTMAAQVTMDLESHDRLIAYVLGLSHALNIAFFTALAESGERAPKLATLSSTTFDEQLGVARKVAIENPRLYFEIQSLNDYGGESLEALSNAVERIRTMVESGDEQGFRSLMEQGRRYLGAREDSEPGQL